MFACWRKIENAIHTTPDADRLEMIRIAILKPVTFLARQRALPVLALVQVLQAKREPRVKIAARLSISALLYDAFATTRV